ncbi:MAG: hypothetical protein AB7O62_01740 [Pirellulales bacterium]
MKCWLQAAVVAALAGSMGLAEENEAVQAVVERAVKAAGGAEKIPAIVHWKERWYLGDSPAAHDREAIIGFPDAWFQDGKNIAKDNDDRAEKAYMVSVWALRPLIDAAAKLALLPGIEVEGRPADGLRVSREGQKDIDLYFDHETGRLARMDWRKYHVYFENWGEADGYHYPAKSRVHHLDGELYLWTEFLEFERLRELPAGLKP